MEHRSALDDANKENNPTRLHQVKFIDPPSPKFIQPLSDFHDCADYGEKAAKMLAKLEIRRSRNLSGGFLRPKTSQSASSSIAKQRRRSRSFDLPPSNKEIERQRVHELAAKINEILSSADSIDPALVKSTARAVFNESSVPAKIAQLAVGYQLAIRPGIVVPYHVAVQKEITSLFGSFNTEWLWPALEVVLEVDEEEIKANPLPQLLKRHLFADFSILKGNRKLSDGVGSGKLLTPAGISALHTHFTTRLFNLLYVIEATVVAIRRQSTSIPRMFKHGSPHKSMHDVLSVLSRELLAGQTLLPKVLSAACFEVVYRQGYFEEVEYQVNEGRFEHDLADGVILARLLELIAARIDDSRLDLIPQLRPPHGDRLRKLYNVRLVLESARQRFKIGSGVKAEDIVGAHRGEILAFVEEILAHFDTNSPRKHHFRPDEGLMKALQELSTLSGIELSPHSLRGLADGRLLAFAWSHYDRYGKGIEAYQGVRLIHKVISAASTTFNFHPDLFDPSELAVNDRRMEAFAKLYLEGLITIRMRNEAAVAIQRRWREISLRKARPSLIASLPEPQLLRNSTASSYSLNRMNSMGATQLYPCRSDSEEERHFARMREQAAIRIQCLVRKFLAYRYAQRLKSAKGDEELKMIQQKQEEAAVKIQALVRRFLARCEYERLKREGSFNDLVDATNCLTAKEQELVAEAVMGDYDLMMLKEQERAVIKIQAWIRKFLARRYVSKMRQQRRVQAVVVIQACVRRFLARCHVERVRHEQTAALKGVRVARSKEELAAIKIQSAVRRYLAMKELGKRKKLAKLLAKNASVAGLDREALEFLRYAQAKANRISSETEELRKRYAELMAMLDGKKQPVLEEKPMHTAVSTIQSELAPLSSSANLDTESSASEPLLTQDTRLLAVVKIQSWYRGHLHRRLLPTEHREKIRRSVQELRRAPDVEENPREERAEPINTRIERYLHHLLSDCLTERRVAAVRLNRLCKASTVAASYVLRRGGISPILSCMASLNRSEASLLITRPLTTLLYTLLFTGADSNKEAIKTSFDQLVKLAIKLVNNHHKDGEIVVTSAKCLGLLKKLDQGKLSQTLAESNWSWHKREMEGHFGRLPAEDARRTVYETILKSLLN